MAVRGNGTRQECEAVATWCAAPQRRRGGELLRQVEQVVGNPIVDAVLSSVSGLVAVLNEERQILAVNDGFHAVLDSADMGAALGLRPGEALACVHAEDHGNGCGTGQYCAGCGAVLAITASLAANRPVEKKCILALARTHGMEEYCFMVRSAPLAIAGHRCVLLFMQDITAVERRAALERTFLHDISNTIMGLGCTVELIAQSASDDARSLHDRLQRLSAHLIREVKVQGAMHGSRDEGFPLQLGPVSTEQIVEEIGALVAGHPAAQGKTVTIAGPGQHFPVVADLPLLIRVLANMLINALEATEVGGTVRFSVAEEGGRALFRTWNRSVIPEQAARRIFQRFFSTKSESGRGLGTYSMKLFGEKILGGTVTFATSAEDGTVFTLGLPTAGVPDRCAVGSSDG